MSLSPGNKALHGRVWAAAKGPPRIGYWQALDRLLDAARAEGRALALAEAADYAAFYAEEQMRLFGDAILHDPVLSSPRGAQVTRADVEKSRALQVDGTIHSAGYHAATHIAEHLRALADPELAGS